MDAEICDRLKQLRKERKMTQEELSRHLKYGKTAISNYENDRNEPSIGGIKKIAEALDVSIDYLLCVNNIRRSYHNQSDSDEMIALLEGFPKLDSLKQAELVKYMEYLIQRDNAFPRKILKVAEERKKYETSKDLK